MAESPFSADVAPDWEAFRACILRQGTPRRVHHIELFLDGEIQDEICRRYKVADGLDPDDPFFAQKRQVALQRFLGYDYVCSRPEGVGMPLRHLQAEDTADLPRRNGRSFMEEHRGPVTTWEDFERYPWPDPAQLTTRELEWYQENLPDDMCIVARGVAHYAEYLAWLMGYESLCFALYDQRDLVRAIYERILELDRACMRLLLQFDRVTIVWGSDDMGFKTGPLIGPDDLREFVLPGHREVARMAHEAGRPYLLHSCGNVETVMEDLITDVRIDAKHSFEDAIEDVCETKRRYGDRIALLGGIDVDFLCRADEAQIRRRVRETLEVCLPGGGFCLGSGNSVANYIPVDHYLAMLDEGRRFTP